MSRSILVVTLSNIGDAIMTTPVLERLHQLYPEASVDLVADPRSSALFEHCPYRGHIFLKEKRLGWRGTLALVRRLRKRRYDLVVDLRTDGLALLLRSRKRLLKWGRKPLGPHAVEDLISILRPIDPEGRIPPARVWPGPEGEARASRLLEGSRGSRWLALAPGANWEPKIWPADRFAQLANALRRHWDDCILLGGDGDQARCQAVAKAIEGPTRNLCGKTDLPTAAAVASRCVLLVGNDSGPGHLAAAAGTPTLTLFGPGQPTRYHPWGQRSRWIAAPDRRLESLTVEQVLVEAEAALSS
ncbi:glycosyltransferase family 9 protein [Thiohalobacter sp.]|uniref:glycosyltransferase family 9 protein n=1 Tax=Thiohalobacter sp. TaxID=2025948 RepID=UPI002617F782|nr:glycosyltransferase family 9 protein [Thiohalobacter sp.]